MNKYLVLLIVNFILIQYGSCQQAPKINDFPYFYSSREFYSNYLINPGYSGFNKQHEFQFNSFGQWAGSTDALKNNSFSYDSWIDKINSGIGFSASAESYGNLDKRYEISGFYSYGIVKSSNYNLILGAKFGVAGRKIVNNLILIDNRLITGSGELMNSPMMDLGLVFNYDNFNFGFAYKNLFESNIIESDYQTKLYSKGFVLNASYTIKPIDKLLLKPQVFDYYYNINSISASIKSEFNEKYLIGFGYETHYKKMDASIALKLFRHFQLGYVFERYSNTIFHGIVFNIMVKPGAGN